MDDNTIFSQPGQSQNVGAAPPVPSSDQTSPVQENQIPPLPVPDQPVQSPLPSVPPAPVPLSPPAPPPPVQPPVENIPSNPSEEVEGEGFFEKLKSGNILKLLIGLVVVFVIILIFLFLVLPLFSKQEKKEVTLIYWGLWEDSNIVQSTISGFQNENPNIKVEYSKQDPKQYLQRFTTRAKNGTGPDIFQFSNAWYPILSEYLLPFSSDVITVDQFKSTYYPVAANDLIKNGAIYGIPVSVDNLALFINKDYFTAAGVEAPKTWSEFERAVKLLTVKDESGKIKTAGAAFGTYDNVNHAPDLISLLFAQNLVDPLKLKDTPKRAAETLYFYTNYSIGEDSIWDNTQDNSLLAFSKGNAAMYFGYSWDYFAIKSMNPEFNIEIKTVPQLDEPKTIAAYWADGVSSKSKNQEEALLFMKYLAQKETAERLFNEQSKTRAFGQPSARIDMADKQKENPLLSAFISQAPYAVSTYFVDSTNDESFNSKLNTYLANAVNSVLGNSSAETAIDTLSKGIDQVATEYGLK